MGKIMPFGSRQTILVQPKFNPSSTQVTQGVTSDKILDPS